MRPIIGISCCTKAFGTFNTPNHAASDTYIQAVLGPVGGVPVLIPAAGECVVMDLLAHLDGLILTGSRSNVQPCLYEGPAHLAGTPEDPARDSTTLPLIRAAITAGLPVLAICRGFQELNVALGGSLDQRIQDLPGRMDHSTPVDQASPRVRTGKAHAVRLEPGSLMARTAGVNEIAVNSLHNQGIRRLAPRLVAEGVAPDGTIEAVRVRDSAGYAVGVQWHPEYDWQSDEISRRLLAGFGREAAGWAARRHLQQAAE